MVPVSHVPTGSWGRLRLPRAKSSTSQLTYQAAAVPESNLGMFEVKRNQSWAVFRENSMNKEFP